MKRILPFLLLLNACAVVVHPTGGDKDETPPQSIRTYPDSQQVNFKDKEIRIYFDEYFEIKDPNGILISPPPAKAPKYEVVGKYLRIVFKEPLRDSTTYTLQLINALHDINEKNVLPDYKLSFSTGSHIDTGYIQGVVYDNFTGQKMEAYTVALFHSNVRDYADSSIFPLYLSKTSSSGTYTLPSIRQGSYTLYTFNDINNNKRIDMGEDMGYQPNPVHTFDTVDLYVAKNALDPPLVTYSPIPLDIRSFKLPFSAPEGGRVDILSSQQSFDKSQVLYTNLIHSDTLHLVDFIKSDIDTLLSYYVTLNGLITDTVKVNYPHRLPSYSVQLKKGQILIPGQAIQFSSNQIIRDIRIQNTQLFIKDTIPLSGYTLTANPFSFTISFPFEEKEQYTFILNKAALHYMDDHFSEADTFKLATTDKNNFGSAAILLSNAHKRLIEVQLLKDLKTEVNYSVQTRSDSVYFDNLPSGEYHVRLIYLDSLSKPDKVIPFKIQPSKVYVHPVKLGIRGGWVLGDFLLNNKEE